MKPIPKGLMISAPSSGTGKTTLMLGLLNALSKRGVDVRPFKSGPDYIDPGFHRAACGRASFNLDTWAMGAGVLSDLIGTSRGGDLALIEGSMGLFDGVASAGETSNGASADISALTGWPVILLLDVSGQAQSAAATALGFKTMRPDVHIAGVVLNKVASPRHENLLRLGMESVGIPVLGALPRQGSVALPERHLGLVQAEEQPELMALLDAAGDFITAHIDLDLLVSVARSHGFPNGTDTLPPPPGQRIALARDAAFSFIYPHLLDHWRHAGAEVLPFSPLANEAPDDSADICWLPGGYPELHAGRLAAADRFRAGLQDFAQTRTVHGECGGYMAMGAGLIDKTGTRHQMAGLLGLETSYETRKMHLGYRLATLNTPAPGQTTGARLRGHEFHYSTILSQPDTPLAHVVDANGDAVPETGSRRGNATGTFFHLIAGAS